MIWIVPPVLERPSVASRDAFGVHWSLAPEAEGGTFPTHQGKTVRDVRRWREQITIPDVESLDWSAVKEQMRSVDRENNLIQGFVEMGLFERSYLLLGMEEALVAYLTEQDAISAMLMAIADYKIALIRKFHEIAQLDMVWYGDDWGTQTNLFVPPDVWRQVIRPPTSRIYDCIKSLGLIINQHSCGKVESIFSDIVEMGADIWNPCQPTNDLARLKREFGDQICFSGGIDSQFVLARPGVSPEEVREEVRRRIREMADGGGYIAAPSHGVPYRPEILEAMNEEIAIFGRAFYASV